MDGFNSWLCKKADLFCRSGALIGRSGPQGRFEFSIFVFMNHWIATGLLLLGGIAPLQGQAVRYTLEQCIDQALKQNIDVQLSMLSASQAELSMSQAKSGFAPDLSAAAGQFYQSGRSIDRFTNQFVQSTIGSNNFQLQGSLLLYGGGQTQNNFKQAKQNWMASEADLEAVKLSVILQVSGAYVQCLQAIEAETAAQNAANASKAQLDRGQLLYDAGGSNRGALLALKAQNANDLATLTSAQNNKSAAIQSLKQLIRLPQAQSFEPATESLGSIETPFGFTAQQLVDSILERRPDYRAAKYRLYAAEYGLRAAKGALLPTLSVGGSLSTVYSDNAKNIDGVNVTGFSPIGRVQGSNEIVEAPSFEYQMSTIAFGEQVKNNFGQSLGVNLNVPIYSGMRRQNQVKTADVTVMRAQLNLDRIEQTVQNEVLTAFNNYQNAEKRYVANRESHELQKQNEQFVKQRLDAGAASYFEYQVAFSNAQSAYQNFISAKYERAFRRLVLEFYLSPNPTMNSVAPEMPSLDK
jgi:outer membrane protein